MTDLNVLWQPLQIGTVTVKNRVFVSAHTTNFGRGNLATPTHVAYHKARARGGVGLIITEALRVHPTSSGRDRSLGVFTDECIEPLRAVVDGVHEEDTKIFGQLIHLGRQANGSLARTASWGAAAEPWATGAHVPHAMTKHEIGLLVDAFASGAERVLAAGFDGLEVHMGHGHLLAQYLSPAVNQRQDEYGGSFDNRTRLARQVLDAVFETVGDQPVGIRFSADEFLDGGIDIGEAIRIAERLVSEFPLAFSDVSHSAYVGEYSLSTQMADMTFPAGAFRHLPAGIKKAFPDMPVFAIGRINTIELAADVVAAGEADAVGMTRAHIADPDIVAKARSGVGVVHRCVACNQACIGRIEHDLPMSCMVNPEVGFEDEWRRWRAETPLPARRKILVVGAGPAGMRAALSASDRGHEVVLAEQTDLLGGQVRMAASVRHREALGHLVEDLSQRIEASDTIEVRLEHTITAEMVSEGGYESVVVATGSTPTAPSGMTDVWTAMSEPATLGDDVVVFDEDGTWAAVGVAIHLAETGKSVVLATPMGGIGPNVPVYVRLSMIPLLKKAGVRVETLQRVKVGRDTTCQIEHVIDGKSVDVNASAVVYVGPRRSRIALRDEILAMTVPIDVITAGDAYAARTAVEAIHEGNLAGILAGGETPPLLTDSGLPPYIEQWNSIPFSQEDTGGYR